MSAKIHAMIVEANNKRLQILLIDHWLNIKKNMNYKLWRSLHLLIEELQGEIREIDEEILRITRGLDNE